MRSNIPFVGAVFMPIISIPAIIIYLPLGFALVAVQLVCLGVSITRDCKRMRT